ncbi:hypothetical protein COBT_000475 [Conglomerata obtusa]
MIKFVFLLNFVYYIWASIINKDSIIKARFIGKDLLVEMHSATICLEIFIKNKEITTNDFGKYLSNQDSQNTILASFIWQCKVYIEKIKAVCEKVQDISFRYEEPFGFNSKEIRFGHCIDIFNYETLQCYYKSNFCEVEQNETDLILEIFKKIGAKEKSAYQHLYHSKIVHKYEFFAGYIFDTVLDLAIKK